MAHIISLFIEYIKIKRKIDMFQIVANIISFSNKSKKIEIVRVAANIISLYNKRKNEDPENYSSEIECTSNIFYAKKKRENLDIQISMS